MGKGAPDPAELEAKTKTNTETQSVNRWGLLTIPSPSAPLSNGAGQPLPALWNGQPPNKTGTDSTTFPPFPSTRWLNNLLSSVMCLEHPLSRNHLLLTLDATRATYTKGESSCSLWYPSLFGSINVSIECIFWNPNLLKFLWIVSNSTLVYGMTMHTTIIAYKCSFSIVSSWRAMSPMKIHFLVFYMLLLVYIIIVMFLM